MRRAKKLKKSGRTQEARPNATPQTQGISGTTSNTVKYGQLHFNLQTGQTRTGLYSSRLRPAVTWTVPEIVETSLCRKAEENKPALWFSYQVHTPSLRSGNRSQKLHTCSSLSRSFLLLRLRIHSRPLWFFDIFVDVSEV